MFDAFEQDTNAQDKAILALTDKATSAAALNLIHATGKELELVGRWGPEGHILMICEAIAQGIHVDDLADHFRREIEAAKDRAKDKRAMIEAVDRVLKARRGEVREHDAHLESMRNALQREAASLEASLIGGKERDEKMERLREAAVASGVDVEAVLGAVPPPPDAAAVMKRVQRMRADADAATKVLFDPLRRLEALPEWMRECISIMEPGGKAAALAMMPY